MEVVFNSVFIFLLLNNLYILFMYSSINRRCPLSAPVSYSYKMFHDKDMSKFLVQRSSKIFTINNTDIIIII